MRERRRQWVYAHQAWRIIVMEGVRVDGRGRAKQHRGIPEVELWVEGHNGSCPQARREVHAVDGVGFQLGKPMVRDTALHHGVRHPGITVMVKVVVREASQAGMPAVLWWHSPGRLSISSSDQLHCGIIDVTDGVCSRPHGSSDGSLGGSIGARASYAVLAYPVIPTRHRRACTLAAVARTR